MTKAEKLELLNESTAEERLKNLSDLINAEKSVPEQLPQYANNHIHTTYSFSPYSPTAAVYFAREAGLKTAGIMDHDSIGGAAEFRKAGKIAGVEVTCGMECRCNLHGTALEGRKLNNPDQDGVAYMTIHSVMPEKYAFLQKAFAPLRERRNSRNRAMVDKINDLMSSYGIKLDFEKDVVPVSLYEQGGTVTERHLMWALAGKMIDVLGLDGTVDCLEKLGITLSDGQRQKISGENEYLQYDLLGILKAEMIGKIYIPATDECLKLNELVKLADEAGAILCYAYLGDVGDSVTGDKRTEKYEDSFLDELFEVLQEQGVTGLTYMPSRNTDAQIARVRALCNKHSMTEISGEDINSPRQSFICQKLAEPGFSHLVDATWKLIEREKR